MTKKPLFLAIATLALLVIASTFWLTKKQALAPMVSDVPSVISDDALNFVTEVDSDVNHWQTKETEFFSIKFPREWKWLESDFEETGYRSVVITNNPEFQINEYADISLGTGGNYPLVLKNDSEVVISTNNLGWVTTNVGSPREFLEFEIDRVKQSVNPFARCEYLSDFKQIPLIAKCTYVNHDFSQKVVTYYASDDKRTFAYSARTSENSNFNIDQILELITRSFVLKKDF